MAELIKFKSRIKSIRNLRQITGAIELVAKIKIGGVRSKFQNRTKYRSVVESIFSRVYNYSATPVLDAKATHIICVFFSQKGFCGAFNDRLMRRAASEVACLGEPCTVWCFGRKSKKWEYTMRFPFQHILLDEDHYAEEIGALLEQWHQAWSNGGVRSIRLIYNQFKSVLVQEAQVVHLFPFTTPQVSSVNSDPIFETPPQDLFSSLLMNWWRAVIEVVYWEGLLSENCARLISMKSANDNADLMLDHLKITYNKMRQASITQELSEVVTAFDVLRSLSQTVTRKEWFQ